MNVIEITLVMALVLQGIALTILSVQHERTKGVVQRMAFFVAAMASAIDESKENNIVLTK